MEESKLKSVLKEKGIKYSEFAKMMNVAPQSINQWINRGVPHARELEVAKKLGVSVARVSQKRIDQQGVYGLSDKDYPKSSREFVAVNGEAMRQMPKDELLKLIGSIEVIIEQEESSEKFKQMKKEVSDFKINHDSVIGINESK